MNFREIIIGLLVLGGLAWLLSAEFRAPPETGSSSEPGAGSTVQGTAATLPQLPGEQAATEARIAELKAQEEYLNGRARALESRAREARNIEVAYAARWREFLAASSAIHQQQREQARADPTKQISCAVCDGTHMTSTCVVCLDRPKECPTCLGTGRGTGSDPCASCDGTGKCPMCSGTFRMLCPYCDDGVVDVTLELPGHDFTLH